MVFSLFDPTFPFMNLIQTQSSALRQAAGVLNSIVRDFQELAERCGQIRQFSAESEKAADEVARQLTLTFLKPEDRRDIHELNLALQEAMVAVRNVSTRIGLYGFPEMRPAALDVTETLLEILDESSRLASNPSDARVDGEHRAKVRRLKEQAQMFLLVGLGETYERKPTTPADVLDAVKWGQIYDRLEEAVLGAVRVMEILEGIIIKRVRG